MARDTLTVEYLEAVAGRIRWRRARGPLLRELEDHIVDQTGCFERAGLSPAEAQKKAVAEMGDPAEVGAELDRLHRPRNRWGLVLIVLALTAVGIAALFAVGWDRDQLFRQLLALGTGLVVCGAVWFSDYTLLIRKLGPACAILAVCAFFIMPTLFAIGYQSGIKYFAYHSAEFKLFYVFLLFPVLYAALICRIRGRGKVTVAGMGLLALALGLFFTTLLNIPAGITVAGVCLLTLGVAAVAGCFKGKRAAALLCAWGPPLLLGISAVARHWQWVYRRYFLPPETDPLGRGWFVMSIRAILADLPFLNPGGAPISDVSSFPYDNALLLDLANRFGWVVILLAVVLLLGFAAYMVLRILRLKSGNGRLVAVSCAALLLAQGTGELLNNVGIMFPLMHNGFPLLTYGPGLLLVDLFLVGLLLSVFRMDTLVRECSTRRISYPVLPGALDIPLPFGKGSIHIERREM